MTQLQEGPPVLSDIGIAFEPRESSGVSPTQLIALYRQLSPDDRKAFLGVIELEEVVDSSEPTTPVERVRTPLEIAVACVYEADGIEDAVGMLSKVQPMSLSDVIVGVGKRVSADEAGVTGPAADVIRMLNSEESPSDENLAVVYAARRAGDRVRHVALQAWRIAGNIESVTTKHTELVHQGRYEPRSHDDLDAIQLYIREGLKEGKVEDVPHATLALMTTHPAIIAEWFDTRSDEMVELEALRSEARGIIDVAQDFMPTSRIITDGAETPEVCADVNNSLVKEEIRQHLWGIFGDKLLAGEEPEGIARYDEFESGRAGLIQNKLSETLTTLVFGQDLHTMDRDTSEIDAAANHIERKMRTVALYLLGFDLPRPEDSTEKPQNPVA